MLGLLIEPHNSTLVIHPDHAEAASLSQRKLDRAHHHVGLLGDHEVVHLGIIHFVDVVAGQDKQKIRLFIVHQEQILIDRIGGPLVPIFTDALLGRDRGDELAHFLVEDIPAPPDMSV